MYLLTWSRLGNILLIWKSIAGMLRTYNTGNDVSNFFITCTYVWGYLFACVRRPDRNGVPLIHVSFKNYLVVKLFYCFDAMVRNVNKQSRICGTFSTNTFCNILTCMDNFIQQFLILTGVGLLLKYG